MVKTWKFSGAVRGVVSKNNRGILTTELYIRTNSDSNVISVVALCVKVVATCRLDAACDL